MRAEGEGAMVQKIGPVSAGWCVGCGNGGGFRRGDGFCGGLQDECKISSSINILSKDAFDGAGGELSRSSPCVCSTAKSAELQTQIVFWGGGLTVKGYGLRLRI